MRVDIKPPIQSLYLERGRAAQNCFKHFDVMPPFLVTYMCFSVMFRALGGYSGVVRYVLYQIYVDIQSNVRERIWWTWHLYIRCRSKGEIRELIDQRLEELSGEDHREWPDIVTEDELR